uniref:Protein SMG7 n=1 Tax=Anthurium amnicola TaxID=1678845 RepID=A0A1D1YWQ9_9ARAE
MDECPLMDSSPAPRSRELAQRLFQKNLELEEAKRKAAKLKIPSDQNAWAQMRDNFETILLEDHDFAEKHGVEYSLWQLHHRKIDEYRSHLSTASAATQGGKVTPRPDRSKKIFAGFKSFLSEASGFYHDLILKVRAKYGLPLGYFSEGPENQNFLSKDDKKSSDVRRALISCHRCFIFLGDLARYKGMYGEGDSAKRDYAAASSYYQQAASIWPSSGNPHHQLAILAICTDDNELTTIYRYFRSLAVENPLLTAKDNLVVAFEKNRQRYSQLPAEPRTTSLKAVPTKVTGRGRGYTGVLVKHVKTEDAPTQERVSVPEIFSAFCTQFVRLNGILYTRTSLETFEEIFSSVANNLSKLLSSGPDEELNFGSDAAENGTVVVRLVVILIFTAHNVNKESEGQSYAEILQRSVLLQNAFTTAFEFMGHILKRCIGLHDATSSYLLPAILVFIEWLACHPDIASGVDVEEKQATARSFFWNNFVSLMNKFLLTGLVSFGGDEDETCFFDMSRYDEGETENRLALWEDFELRGFVPSMPAQLILNFSSNHSFGNDVGNREKKSRIQRIFAAGRSLMNMVQVDQQKIYFNSKVKKYIIGNCPQVHEDKIPIRHLDFSKPNGFSPVETYPVDSMDGVGSIQTKAQLQSEGEEEDEVIVFKPTVTEKSLNGLKSTGYEVIPPCQDRCPTSLKPIGYEVMQPIQSSSGDWANYLRPLSEPLTNAPPTCNVSSYMHPTAINVIQQPVLTASGSTHMKLPAVNAFQQPVQSVSDASSVNVLQQPLQHAHPATSKWLMDQEPLFSDGLKNLRIIEDGFGFRGGMWEGLSAVQPTFTSIPFPGSAGSNGSSLVSNQIEVCEIPSNLDAVVSAETNSDGLSLSLLSTLPVTSRKNPVGRPVRHFGPPPGFNSIPSKQLDDVVSSSSVKDDRNPLVDDYSWLDGYSPAKSVASGDFVNQNAYVHPHVTSGVTDSLTEAMSFPFPGKQIPSVPTQVESNSNWQDYQLIQRLKLYAEKQAQQGNQQPGSVLDQAQSLWPNRYFV